MAKKIDFDETAKKIEGVANTVDIIMKNRLIIAVFLIVDGITFLQNPDTTLNGMAQNIILLALLATFTVFITSVASKVKDVKTIVISALILVVGGIFYFFPDLIAAYIQVALALFIIYDGVKNIANTLHLSKLSGYTQKLADKYEKITHRKAKDAAKQAEREKFKEVDDSLDNGLDEQAKKLMSPLQNIVNKTSKFSWLYIAANVMTVVLGVVLLVYPGASMMVWGLIFLYTGITNFVASVKSMGLAKKLRERKFKEIVFDAEKEVKGEETKKAELDAGKAVANKAETKKDKVIE